MATDNQKNKPVLLIALTILFVIVLSHFLGGVTIFGYTVKPVDLFMDIKPDSLLSYNINTQPGNTYVKSENLDAQNVKYTHVGNFKFNSEAVKAEMNLNLLNDTFKKVENSNSENYNNSNFQMPNIKDVPITGNLEQMKFFFNALKKVGSEKVRVAHYGDSGNEGDNITSSIRAELQKKFGGNGVGYLSITSQDITFRNTTKMSFSDNWKTVSVLTANPNNIPLGVNGFVAIPQGDSWVRYQTTSWLPYLKSFSIVRLFYSNAKSSSIRYQFNDGGTQSVGLSTGSGVKELDIKAPNGDAHSIKIMATMPNQAYFYGASLENGNGIYVDDFPWRGNTGLGFNNIAESQFKQFSKLLNYKLLILQYGANETSFGTSQNSWYENQMIKVINNLKKAFPQTSILLLGVGDRAVKRGTRFVTDPNIPPLIKTQEKIASKTGVAFWNLFEAMGGRNSMDSWVKANMALMDYTHPSLKGANKIGQMIAQALIESYNSH